MKHAALTWALVALGLLAAPVHAADTVYYYSSDTIHSEVVVTDQNRNVVERTYYAPYGQVLNRDLRDGPGYTGHEEDPETNLVYMQQRYYDPEAGRFLSTDPVQADGEGGSFNRYAYAGDNPYSYYDPDGRMKDQDQERSPGCTGSLVAGGCGVVNMSTIVVDSSYRRGNAISAKPAAANPSATSINKFLTSKSSPMATQGNNFMEIGKKYDLDPRLLVAIAGAETTFGRNITAGQYNAFNILYNGHNSPFKSWQSAINALGHSLTNPRNGYDLRTTTTMYRTYCAGSDCTNGLRNINIFMHEQGANPNSLIFPKEGLIYSPSEASYPPHRS